jgi:carbamoyltransferase
MSYILGISAFYHDSAACLLKEGDIVAAAQEERFTRVKHDQSFPAEAIKYCLNSQNIKLKDVDHIVFYDKPFLKFERILETYLSFAPSGFKNFCNSIGIWVKEKLFQKHLLLEELSPFMDEKNRKQSKTILKEKLLFSEHHLSHAASAFFPSPYKKAAILTMDGVGEWATTSIAYGEGNNIRIDKEIFFPHSIGLLYSAFTYYLGFKVNSGEYKVMGLAPYGEPRYYDLIISNLIDIHDDGSFALDMSFFGFCTGSKMTNQKFDNLFGSEPRPSESELSQRDMDIAASIQKVAEEVIIKISKNIAATYGRDAICLAGGVALNCVANGVLVKENIFDNIWVQPAAGDAGGSLGAALSIHYLMLQNPRNTLEKLDSMKGSYLGPEFKESDVRSVLNNLGAITENYSNIEDLISIVASELANGKAIGWMNGRMEFGPRALGARSIIADPRSIHMQKILNLKVKFRESFRPFAPSILRENLEEWFQFNSDSPYMLFVSDILDAKKNKLNEDYQKLFGMEKLNISRSSIPAVTHVDFSARIQTVHQETNPTYHQLIKEFYRITGCPVLVNTSFNVRGEPIVCSPEDAFQCFMGTELDLLVIGNSLLYKNNQNPDLKISYQSKYELD